MLGYSFKDPALLFNALTHRSYLREDATGALRSNEQMELLGDAVLDLIVVEFLFYRYPEWKEGELSKMKSNIVSGQSLSRISRDIGLGRFVLLSENESLNGGRNRASILEDTLEAVIASIYLDGGYNAASRFVDKMILPKVATILKENIDHNFKSVLLELSQANGWGLPRYRVVDESGPDHAKHFEVEVFVENRICGCGRGRSKKVAQQQAAEAALQILTEEENGDQ